MSHLHKYIFSSSSVFPVSCILLHQACILLHWSTFYSITVKCIAWTVIFTAVKCIPWLKYLSLHRSEVYFPGVYSSLHPTPLWLKFRLQCIWLMRLLSQMLWKPVAPPAQWDALFEASSLLESFSWISSPGILQISSPVVAVRPTFPGILQESPHLAILRSDRISSTYPS